MAAHDEFTPKAIALRIVADLDSYETDKQDLADRWPDAGLLDTIAMRVDTLRAQALELADVAACWTEFQLSHAQVLFDFARTDSMPARYDRLERHMERLLELEAQCLLIATQGRGIH